MTGPSNSGKPGASEALSLVFRIATVGLSVASAIMTAASTESQCVHDNCSGEAAANVSSNDYKSFKYSALADLLSAVLQGAAIYLQVVRKDKAAKVVELIDKILLALTSTSAALLLAVDDITSCGLPRRGGRRRRSRFCTQAGRFCGNIRASSALSLVAAVSVSVSVYTRHMPASVKLTIPATTPVVKIPTEGLAVEEEDTTFNGPPRGGGRRQSSRFSTQVVEGPTTALKIQEHVTHVGSKSTTETETECQVEKDLTSPVTPPPCCGCPRLTITQGCENPEPSGAVCVYVSE